MILSFHLLITRTSINNHIHPILFFLRPLNNINPFLSLNLHLFILNLCWILNLFLFIFLLLDWLFPLLPILKYFPCSLFSICHFLKRIQWIPFTHNHPCYFILGSLRILNQYLLSNFFWKMVQDLLMTDLRMLHIQSLTTYRLFYPIDPRQTRLLLLRSHIFVLNSYLLLRNRHPLQQPLSPPLPSLLLSQYPPIHNINTSLR
jgi:hypothetical protein